jgi:cyclic pyranopterin phosphate synthase
VDSVDPETFRNVRRGELAPVLNGIRGALDAGLKPLKLNMVVLRHTVERIPEMIDYVGRTDGLKLQLIQFMPELVGQEEWMVDMDSVRNWLAGQADREIVREMHHRHIYLIQGAEVEVVDPVYNQDFCNNCHRLRVTHDGQLKGCLNRDDDHVTTRGLTDEGVRQSFRKAVMNREPFYGVHVREFPVRDSAMAPRLHLPTARRPEP